jgi:hypothetical protein
MKRVHSITEHPVDVLIILGKVRAPKLKREVLDISPNLTPADLGYARPRHLRKFHSKSVPLKAVDSL